MPNSRDITVIISADPSGAINGIRQVGDATGRFSSRTAGLLDQARQQWVLYTAGIYAAAASLQKAWDFAEKAAAHAESLETLNALSSQYNVTGQQMVETIFRNSEGLIGQAAAAKVAADAIAKGFTPAQLAQIARWAPVINDFSSSVGSSAEAFETLVSSMAAGRERGTVQLLGATIDLKTAFGEQAASMSKAEKATALYNLVAQRMTEIQKAGVGSTDSLADKMERLKNQVEGLKLAAGGFIIRAGAGLLATFQSVSALALGLTKVVMAPITALMLATDYLGVTKGKAAEYKAAMEALGSAAEYTAIQAAANFELMKKGMQSGTALAAGVGNLGFGEGNAKELEAFVKARERMLGALSKFWEDSAKLDMEGFLKIDVIRKAHIAAIKEEQAALQSQAGIWNAQGEAMAKRNEEEQKRLKIEQKITDLGRQQLDLILSQKAARLQETFSALGAGDMGQKVGMLTAIEDKIDPYTRDYQAWEKIQDEKIQKMIELGITEAELRDEYRAYDLRQEEMLAQQKAAIAQNSFGVASGLAMSLYKLSGQKNKEAFRAYQAFATAEAIVSTAAGVARAFKDYQWPYSMLVAAAVAAAGAVQIATIASAEPGRTGGISGIGGAGGGFSATPAIQGTPATETKREGPVVNVHVYGNVVSHDEFAREITPYLTKAWEDGAR